MTAVIGPRHAVAYRPSRQENDHGIRGRHHRSSRDRKPPGHPDSREARHRLLLRWLGHRRGRLPARGRRPVGAPDFRRSAGATRGPQLGKGIPHGSRRLHSGDTPRLHARCDRGSVASRRESARPPWREPSGDPDGRAARSSARRRPRPSPPQGRTDSLPVHRFARGGCGFRPDDPTAASGRCGTRSG